MVLVFFALMAGGNHCALFAFQPAPEDHSCCADQAPATENCNECCDHLVAPLPTLSASVLPADLPPLAFLPIADGGVLEASAPDPSPAGWESPPGRFFTEVVFASGLSSLAPPDFVS